MVFATIGAALMYGWAAAAPVPTLEEASLAKVSPEMREFLRKPLPEEVLGAAIVRATVGAIRGSSYCGGKTPQCGLNPECDHVKRLAYVGTFKITGTLLNKDKLKLPTSLEQYRDPPDATKWKAGDITWMVLHVIKTDLSVRIAMIEKIKLPPAKKGSKDGIEDPGDTPKPDNSPPVEQK